MAKPLKLFLGQSVLSNVVQSQCMTFADFAATYCVSPRLVDLSVAAFHDLSKKRQLKYKDGPFVAACTFSGNVRSTVNAEHINLLCIDIDDHVDAASVFDELTIDALIGQFNFVAYPTISSTKEKQRIRVFVETDGEMLAAKYTQAVRTIAKLLGLREVSKESLIVSQAMFLPAVLKGAGYKLISNYRGRAFCESDIDVDFVVTTTKPTATTESEDDVDLLHLVAPLEVSDAVVLEALKFIDPDVEYPKWLSIGCAIKHQYQHHPDRGFQIFNDWSAGGAKYTGPEDTRQKWGQFKANPKGRDPITVRSLFADAQKNGWVDTQDQAKLYTIETTIKRATSATALEKALKTLSTMRVTTLQRELLISDAQAKFKELGKTVRNSVVRDLCAQRGEAGVTEDRRKVPEWCRDYVYLQLDNVFFDTRTKARLNGTAFNATYDIKVLTSEDLSKGVYKAPPSRNAQALALSKFGVPIMYNGVYIPGAPRELEYQGQRCINTYSKNELEPSTDSQKIDEVGTAFKAHLSWLLNNQYEERILLDFLAFPIQNPGKRVNWAIMLQGGYGAGKTLLSSLVSVCLGDDNVSSLDNGTIMGDFTGWAYGKQFVTIEEIRVSGSNRFAVMDKLKPFITNDVIVVREKFRKEFNTPNVATYLMFSNYLDALAINENDRRYCVLRSEIQTKAQIQNKLDEDPDYFSRLFGYIQNNPGECLAFLLDHKISDDFNAKGHAPVDTRYRQMSIDLAKSELQLAVDEILEDGYKGVYRDYLSTKCLMDALRVYEIENGMSVNASPRALAKVLSEKGYLYGMRIKANNENHNIWYGIGEDPRCHAPWRNKYLSEGEKK